MTTSNPTDNLGGDAVAPVIPAAVLRRLHGALASLSESSQRMKECADGDATFGGQGRYEVDAYLRWRDAIEHAHKDLATIRERAAAMGATEAIEAEISKAGGVADTALSRIGQAYYDGSTKAGTDKAA